MKAWLSALLSLAVALPLPQAQALPAQDQTPPPVFSAGVELVRLDVRVTDDLGRPIRDLRADEVQVVEDGRTRPVVLFQHIEEPTEPLAEVVSRTVSGEVSTNQGAARGHLYVLLFDQLHISPGNEQRARVAAQQFVRTRLRRGDRVALYALPGPGPQIGFTADGARIAAELEKVRGIAEPQTFGAIGSMSVHEAFDIVRGNELTLQRVADRLLKEAAPTDVGQRRTNDPNGISFNELVRENADRIADLSDGDARRVLAMISDVLTPLRAIEGRKTVILVSEGFEGARLDREIQDVAAAAAEAYGVVYALDINRRVADAAADAPIGGDQAAAIHDRTAPLGTLAAETGGSLVIDASERASDVLATLADQSQDYYLIGFAPASASQKDRSAYRPVTVRVTRSGARVSTRTGFVLTDPAAKLDSRQAVERALTAPFPQQALPVQYTTYVLRGQASGLERVILSLSAGLPIAASAPAHPADVVFVVRSTSDGHVAASGHDVIPLPTRADAHATTASGTYQVQFEVPPGDYLMRAVVREPGGLVGSADRRFTVRALDGPALTSGDLVLSSARGELPVRPVAYTGDGLSGVLDLYARTGDQLRDAHVVVDVMPIGESAAAVSGDADLQEIRLLAGGAAREARVEVPLDGVTPGTYLARARVMAGRDTAAEVVREVDIRSGRRPTVQAAADLDAPFDPRDVVEGAFGRSYAARLQASGSSDAAALLHALERLAARDYPAAIAGLQAGTDGAAAFFLGWAYFGADEMRQAISAWRQAAYLDPTLVPAHLALADVYVRLSQPALAVQALKAGLAALPQSPELLDRLSRLEHR